MTTAFDLMKAGNSGYLALWSAIASGPIDDPGAAQDCARILEELLDFCSGSLLNDQPPAGLSAMSEILACGQLLTLRLAEWAEKQGKEVR